MKFFLRLFAVLLLCTAAVGSFAAPAASPAAETGAPAPELEVKKWIKGDPIRLADLKGKKCVVLFFWTLSQNGTAAFAQIGLLAHKLGEKEVQFVAIGCDSADSIAKFNRLNELPFPVAADNMLATVNRYMRSNDRIPMAAIIDRNGVLAWRGAVSSLAGVLPEVIAGKFNIQQHVEREKFSQAVMSAIRIKDYPSALKLLDDELKKNPGNLELLNVKLPLQGKLMKDLDGAEKSALAAVEKNPKEPQLYWMIMKLLESDRPGRLAPWIDRVATNFSDQPRVLLKFAQQEMNQPLVSLRPWNACKLLETAWKSGKFKDDRERGIAAGEYARALYFCGRPDLALSLSKEAVKLLKGTREAAQANALAVYLNTVILASKRLK